MDISQLEDAHGLICLHVIDTKYVDSMIDDDLHDWYKAHAKQMTRFLVALKYPK